MFEVKFMPGGVEDLIKRSAGFSQENEANKFVVLDGDKTKPKIDPLLLSGKENILHFTNLYIGEQTDASYQSCCKLFIKEFVRKQGEDYKEIIAILNRFKSILIG